MESTIKNNFSHFSKTIVWLNRIVLFVVFFWFGIFKILQVSPAEALVTHLHQLTLARFLSVEHFLLILGIVECLIGVLWLIPQLTKYVMLIFLVQMFTTFMPLIFLPGETWQHSMVLSLTGQYIVKNIVLIACAFTIYYDCKMQTEEMGLPNEIYPNQSRVQTTQSFRGEHVMLFVEDLR